MAVPLPHGDVEPRVQAAPAHAERRDDRPVDGPDQLATAGLIGAGCRNPGQRGLDARLLGLERLEVALERHAAVVYLRERAALVGPG